MSCRFLAGWVREEEKEKEKSSENRQRKTEAEEPDKIKVAPRVTIGSLRLFRAALIGRTHGLPKQSRLRR